MPKKKKMILLALGIFLIVVAIAGGIWWYTVFFHGCNPPLPRQTVKIGNNAFDAEMATTMVEQACGLSGRLGLDDGHGMFFRFGSAGTQTFWMKDMNFPIDIIWIAGDTVAGSAENADPQIGVSLWKLKIYSSPVGVDNVLEVPAGTVAKYGIHIGDPVSTM